jgi:DNA-directed RNA polymerase specialized sigma subunit
MAKPENKTPEQEMLEILREIKKLLVLSLLKKEVGTKEIGAALGVSYKTVERLVPKKSK